LFFRPAQLCLLHLRCRSISFFQRSHKIIAARTVQENLDAHTAMDLVFYGQSSPLEFVINTVKTLVKTAPLIHPGRDWDRGAIIRCP